MTDLFGIGVLGDVVGKQGRELVKTVVPVLRKEYGCDCVIVNAENSAGGMGVTAGAIDEMAKSGVDCFTLGDHTFQQKDFRSFMSSSPKNCIRPANYPEGAPGLGVTEFEIQGLSIGVMNLMGRVFMNGSLDCPFQCAENLISQHLSRCDVIVCDFHAEATSEKIAMGRFLNGKVTVVVGTHTHVQTADEQILDQGTAYISDLGMCGVMDGVIGMDSSVALERFLTGLPKAYKLAKGKAVAHGLVTMIDRKSFEVKSVQRVQIAADS